MNDLMDLYEYTLSLIESDSEVESEFSEWKGYGYCCYCNQECNPASQSCGVCLRNGYAMEVYFDNY